MDFKFVAALVAGLVGWLVYERYQKRKAQVSALTRDTEIESAKVDGKILAVKDKLDDNKAEEKALDDKVKNQDAVSFWKGKLK